MKLILTPGWRVESDQHCWILQKCRVSQKGVLTWDNRTYHSSLSDAINHIPEMALRESSANTVTEALAELESLTHSLTASLRTQFEVTVK